MIDNARVLLVVFINVIIFRETQSCNPDSIFRQSGYNSICVKYGKVISEQETFSKALKSFSFMTISVPQEGEAQ